MKWRILLQKWFRTIVGACLVRKSTLIWQPADDLRKTRMVIFPHSNICRGLSCVVSVLRRPQYCKLSISYFKYDTFFTTAKELKTILSRNGLVIKVFQFHSFLSKNSRTHSMTMGNLNKSKATTQMATTALKVAL